MYKNKYLKYKNKYLELKNQYGSANESKKESAVEREEQTCGICLELINDSAVSLSDNRTVLHCNHIFHRSCLINAYNSEHKHIRCAFCREPFNITDRNAIGIPLEDIDPKDSVIARQAELNSVAIDRNILINRNIKEADFELGTAGYASIYDALQRYNLNYIDQEDETVYDRLSEDEIDRRSNEADKAFEAINTFLKHSPNLANYIIPESGRHILSYVIDNKVGRLLIGFNANRDHIDAHMRTPLSYVNYNIRRDLTYSARSPKKEKNNQIYNKLLNK